MWNACMTTSLDDQRITKAEALAAFDGNRTALARFLGIRQQAVSAWLDGPIPELREYQLRKRLPLVFGGVRAENAVDA